MELFKLSGKITADNDEAKQKIKETTDTASKAQRTMDSVFEKIGLVVEKAFKTDSVKKFDVSLERLESRVKGQEKELDLLKNKYKDLYMTQGENSKEAKECADKIQALSTELKDNRKKLSEAEDAVKKFDNSLDEAGDEAKKAEKKFDKVFTNIGKFAMKAGKVVAVGLAAIATGFVGLGTMATNYNAEIEQYQTSFEVMLGSQEEALKMMDTLKEKAASTPFEMPDLAETTQLLLNYGLTADQATDKMLMLGDIAQGNADKMKSVATAYGQMSSAGKVSLEDVKQMIEAGFNPLQEISESTGESMASLYDRISKGTLAVDEITASMERSTSEGGKYFESMKKQSETLSGRLSTLKDTVMDSLGTAFKPISKILATNIIPRLQDIAEEYIPKLGVVVEKLLPPFMNIIDMVFPGLVAGLDMFLPMVMDLAEMLLPMLGSALESLAPIFMDVAQMLLPAIVNLLGLLLPSAIQIIESLLPYAVQIIEMLLPPLMELVDALLPILVEMFQEFLPTLEPILETLQPLLDLFMLLAIPLLQIAADILPAFISMMVELNTFWLNALLPGLKNVVKFLDENLGGAFRDIMPKVEEATSFVVDAFGMVENFISKASEVIWDVIAIAILSIVETIESKLTKAYEFVTSIFESIVSGIEEKMNAAKEIVSTIIEAIKGFFDFEFKIPDIKLPHFKITPSGWEIGDLLKGIKPELGIEWYAKGAVLNKPTIFGMNGDNAMVGGEAGSEAVAPIDVLQGYVAEAVASQNQGLLEILYKILEAIIAMDENMGRKLAEALEGTEMTVDGRTFGRMVNKYA